MEAQINPGLKGAAMTDISPWMTLYRDAVLRLFGARVLFVGLQGSRARGEARAGSDIDVVLILDKLLPGDLEHYRVMLDTLPHRELVCGFVSGRAVLSNWTRAELFQFYYDTDAVYGRLDDLFPRPGAEDARLAVQNGACAIYHACCHNFVHEHDMSLLCGLYKSALFVLQAAHFVRTGRYIRTHAALREALTGENALILQRAGELQSGSAPLDCFGPYSEGLICWAQRLIVHT